jgi:hypothetical protein
MKVLLTTINSKYIHQNLAIRLLFELNKSFEELSWKEFISKCSCDDIVDYCADYQLVAFSCYIWNITKTLEVVSKIKELNPECRILLGGPEVSYNWKEIIALKQVDFIILGEGEIPFSQFLNSYPTHSDVPGLVWKKDGKVIENKSPEALDLQLLKNINPYGNEPAPELYHKICYIEASRGCPHCCGFCLAGLDNKLRYLPIESVQSNLLYLIDNAKVIKFLDRTFNANPKHAISIFRFILENYKPGNIFQFEIKADVTQPELIEFINLNVPKGIFRFEIGIQTLNSKSNDAVKRKQNFENTRKFIQQVSDKIEIHLDLIVGLPYDYWEDIKYSFEEVFKLYAPELQLGFLKFIKGTPIRENALMHGYHYDPLPPYQITKSNFLTTEELNKIELLEKVLDIYWNKKRALHTLKYISAKCSIFDFLIELGAFFKNKTGFTSYDIYEVFTNIYEFSVQYFPNDIVIQELITINYYLHYKVKPKIRFLQEIGNVERNKILTNHKLNHHKFRYIMHPIHFNISQYFNKNEIELSEDLLIIQYDGVGKPQIIF